MTDTNGEPTPTKMAVTCHTVADPANGILEDCPENGITYIVNMYPAAIPPTWRAMCAGCGQTITDITPAVPVSP